MGERNSSSAIDKLCKNQVNLVGLPNEILFQILSQLPKDTLFWNIGLTCQKCFVITRDILEHQVQLCRNATSFDVLDSRINILLKYKEILSSIGSFSFDYDDSYTLRTNLKAIINSSNPETQPALNILCHKKLRIEDATKICHVLRLCSNLKGLFINKELLDRPNVLSTLPEQSFQKSSVSSNVVCQWISSLNNTKLEFLSIISFKEEDAICDAIVKNWDSTLKYLYVNKCRFTRNTILRTLESCSKLHHVILYGVPEIENDIQNEVTNISTIEYGIISPYWKERAFNLREQFCKYGSCGRELTEEQARCRLRLDSITDIPEPLMALLMAAREWHSIR